MILAQITDPHIKAGGKLAYGKVDTVAYLKAAIDHINNVRPAVDAVLVTGDLTDMGTPAEFETLRPLLDALTMPWYPIPGNHDARENFRAAFEDLPAIKSCGSFIQYVVEDFPLRLIGLDTVVNEQPHGFLCAERLDWLEKTLLEDPDKPTLLFLHHPPFKTGITHMDVQNLTNGEDLFALLKNHLQVKHIACGHVHRAIETTINGIGVSIAPNAAHAVTLDLAPDAPSTWTLDPAGLRIFHIDAACHIASHVSYVGQFEGPNPFFAADGQLVD